MLCLCTYITLCSFCCCFFFLLKHNAVSPFGILEPSSITLIAARAIFDTNDEPSFIWMGGGHPDLKLGCSTYHFKQALKPIIADISEPR